MLGFVNEGYSLRDVSKLLGLSRSIVGGLIGAGYVSPARGRRREYRFSFQDLVVLRAAQSLVEAKLPTTRILRSLRRLRTQLPPQVPLSGLRVEAVGDAVVVREGNAQWQPDSGQYILRFQVESGGGRLAFLEDPQPVREPSDDDLFDQAIDLEDASPQTACELYRRAIAINPAHLGAYTNLGRLLHDSEQYHASESVYREGLTRCGRDPSLLFNLALLLEDAKRTSEAADMYRAVLAEAPDMPEAHYNLALLCEAAGLQQEAIRHLSAYRKLRKK